MSLEAFFKSLSITNAVRESRIKGVTEICPANASFQVKFDPDLIAPDDMLGELKRLESAADTSDQSLKRSPHLMLYNDPWTRETLMRFRERHQDPAVTAEHRHKKISEFCLVDDFIAAHSGSPWFVSMVGFVAGLPFLYQMVERSRQIEAPKYLEAFSTGQPGSHWLQGSAFPAASSRAAAQAATKTFGITPMPIYDPRQEIGYLHEFMALFRPGDMVKWKPVTREAYDHAVAEVDAGACSR